MDEMTAFLRTIAQDPDDDARRLIFADWLDEHGFHERARFIRLQVELARMDEGDAGYAEKTAQMRRCGVFTGTGKLLPFDRPPSGGCKVGFQRGFIDAIDASRAETVDASGFALLPLRALRAGRESIEQFRVFTKLKRLEYGARDTPPARLLEMFGPQGWFKNLEELNLPDIQTACLAAGVIPQFDLPRLRYFFLTTDAFYHLGVLVPGEGEQGDNEDYSEPRPWDGLPGYLPRNALPSPKSPLERFIWHSEDDCDFFNEEGWYWRGPTMESLLGHLKTHNLKQIEVVVDYEDHEGGEEGVIAAPYQQSPLQLSSTLDRVTLDDGDLRLLEGSPRKLQLLRVYGHDGFEGPLFALLGQSVCSELESLHVEARGGWGRTRPTRAPVITFPKLRSLRLAWLPVSLFSDCQFPSLTSLLGCYDLKTILERKWPKLQRLDVNMVGSDGLPDLKTLTQSDCCPDLTTLTIGGYFNPTRADFSFLANCPHMPFLSLIRIPDYPMEQAYILDEGKLIPVRGDVMMDDLTPTMQYRVSAVY
jgi:uncharacterized protein (TIGR02996 family)